MEIGKKSNFTERNLTHMTRTTPASGAKSTSTVTNMLLTGTRGKM